MFFLRGWLPKTPRIWSEGEHKLAEILRLPVDQLEAVRLGRMYYYRPFVKPKKDGRDRQIWAPSPALKELQKRLLRRYLQHLLIHQAATGFRRGVSIVTNAQRHAGSAIILTADLTDFFPSTSAQRVRQCFISHGWHGQALNILMRLCVYRGGLPQGAPTSPCLSNLVNIELDNALATLAWRCGAVYTRYGDDLTFSWKTDALPAGFQAAVCRELLAAGYQIQPRKGWQVWRAADEPEITGVVLGRDGRLRPPDAARRQARRLRWWLWWRRDDQAARARLNGFAGFLRLFAPPASKNRASRP